VGSGTLHAARAPRALAGSRARRVLALAVLLHTTHPRGWFCAAAWCWLGPKGWTWGYISGNLNAPHVDLCFAGFSQRKEAELGEETGCGSISCKEMVLGLHLASGVSCTWGRHHRRGERWCSHWCSERRCSYRCGERRCSHWSSEQRCSYRCGGRWCSHWCCCLGRAQHSPKHRGVPSCFSSLCFGEQPPPTVQSQLCPGAAQQWMCLPSTSRNNSTMLIPVWHHHPPKASGNGPWAFPLSAALFMPP